MIIRELIDMGGNTYLKTYSNTHNIIRCDQNGVEYEEAIDLVDTTFTYTETDKVVEYEVSPEDIISVFLEVLNDK